MLKSLLNLIFPPRCPCCGELTDNGDLCSACVEEIEDCEIKNSCRRCGIEKSRCECNLYRYKFFGACAPFYNRGAAQKGMYALKFGYNPGSADFFGRKVAASFQKRFPEVTPDFVCIVPTLRKTARKRNYDYVKMIARAAADELAVDFRPFALKKIRDNERQHTLNKLQRRENVKNAFRATGDFTGKTVLLIDDIKTTGYTLNECAVQLLRSDAAKVYCATALITLNKT